MLSHPQPNANTIARPRKSRFTSLSQPQRTSTQANHAQLPPPLPSPHLCLDESHRPVLARLSESRSRRCLVATLFDFNCASSPSCAWFYPQPSPKKPLAGTVDFPSDRHRPHRRHGGSHPRSQAQGLPPRCYPIRRPLPIPGYGPRHLSNMSWRGYTRRAAVLSMQVQR